MFENSIFISVFLKMTEWFKKQFENSVIITHFLENNDNRQIVENSIFKKVFYVVIRIFSTIFYKTGITRLLRGSIFKITFLWCFIVAFLTPFLPTMLVLALMGAGFISLFLKLVCSRKKMVYFAINKYIYIYAIIYILSTIFSITLKGSLLGGLLSVFFMLSSIFVMNSVKNKKQIHFIIFGLVFAGIIVSLYGYYQYLFPDKFSGVWHDRDMFEDISFRVYSTLDNPNVLGEYFLLIIPLAVAYIINCKKIIGKLFYTAAAGIMMICLILTYSRGCYVGILVAAAAFLVLLDRRFIILGIIALIAMPFVLPESIINRFLSIGNMEDSSTSYRMYIYMGTIAMLKDYWISGIGPGTEAFNSVYPIYAYNQISAPHSHNLFLQVICDCGICGIVMFLAIIYQFYKATFGALTREKNKENRVLIISAISSISGFLVQSLFDYTFYNYRVMLMFWIVLGLGIVFTNIREPIREESHD